MGFSLIAATAIIGVSIVMAIGIIVGTTIPTITDVHDSFKDMKNRAIQQIQIEINITSVTTTVNGSNHDINITVNNEGSETLKTTDFNILVNGTETAFTCIKSYIHPENEAYLIISDYPGNGIRKLKVIADNAISDYYEFTI